MLKQRTQAPEKIVSALRRIDTDLDVATRRMGRMQRELDAEAQRLATLDGWAATNDARLDSLLKTARLRRSRVGT